MATRIYADSDSLSAQEKKKKKAAAAASLKSAEARGQAARAAANKVAAAKAAAAIFANKKKVAAAQKAAAAKAAKAAATKKVAAAKKAVPYVPVGAAPGLAQTAATQVATAAAIKAAQVAAAKIAAAKSMAARVASISAATQKKVAAAAAAKAAVPAITTNMWNTLQAHTAAALRPPAPAPYAPGIRQTAQMKVATAFATAKAATAAKAATFAANVKPVLPSPSSYVPVGAVPGLAQTAVTKARTAAAIKAEQMKAYIPFSQRVTSAIQTGKSGAPDNAKVIEALMAEARAVQVRTGGFTLDVASVEALDKAYSDHVAKVKDDYDRLTKQMESLVNVASDGVVTIPGKKGSPAYLAVIAKYNALIGSKEYVATMAEAQRLYGGTGADGKQFQGSVAQYADARQAMADQQRKYQFDVAQQALLKRATGLGRDSAAADQAAEDYKANLAIGNVLAGKTRWVFDGPGEGHQATIDEELALRQTEYEIEYKRQAAEQDRKESLDYWSKQIEDRTPAAVQKSADAAMLADVIKNYSAPGVAHSDNVDTNLAFMKNNPSVLQDVISRAMAKWDEAHPGPNASDYPNILGIISLDKGKATADTVAYLESRRAAEQRFYALFSASKPGILETFLQIGPAKGVIDVLQALQGAAGSLGKVVASAVTGKPSELALLGGGNLSIDKFPYDIQLQIRDAADAYQHQHRAASADESLKHAVESVGGNWLLNDPAGRKYADEKDLLPAQGNFVTGFINTGRNTKEQARLYEDLKNFQGNFYGGANRGPLENLGGVIKGLSEYGSMPFTPDSAVANLGAQLMDPLVVAPMNIFKYGARAAYVAEKTAGMSLAKKAVLSPLIFQKATNSDIRLTKFLVKLDKTGTLTEAEGLRLYDESRSLVKGLSAKTDAEMVTSKLLRRIGLQADTPDAVMLLSLVQDGIRKNFDKLKIPHADARKQFEALIEQDRLEAVAAAAEKHAEQLRQEQLVRDAATKRQAELKPALVATRGQHTRQIHAAERAVKDAQDKVIADAQIAEADRVAKAAREAAAPAWHREFKAADAANDLPGIRVAFEKGIVEIKKLPEADRPAAIAAAQKFVDKAAARIEPQVGPPHANPVVHVLAERDLKKTQSAFERTAADLKSTDSGPLMDFDTGYAKHEGVLFASQEDLKAFLDSPDGQAVVNDLQAMEEKSPFPTTDLLNPKPPLVGRRRPRAAAEDVPVPGTAGARRANAAARHAAFLETPVGRALAAKQASLKAERTNPVAGALPNLEKRAAAMRVLKDAGDESIAAKVRLAQGVDATLDEEGNLVRAMGEVLTSRGEIWSSTGYIADAPVNSRLHGLAATPEQISVMRIEQQAFDAKVGSVRALWKEVLKGTRSQESFMLWVQKDLYNFGLERRAVEVTPGSHLEELGVDLLQEYDPTEQSDTFIAVGKALFDDISDVGVNGERVINIEKTVGYYDTLSLLPPYGVDAMPMNMNTVLMEAIMTREARSQFTPKDLSNLLTSVLFSEKKALSPLSFRQGMGHLFALFHMTALDVPKDATALERLSGYSALMETILSSDPKNLYARAWQVMEKRAGHGGIKTFEDVELAFMDAVLANRTSGIHPNLALGMIPYGPVARKLPTRYGFAVNLKNLVTSTSKYFAAAPAYWASPMGMGVDGYAREAIDNIADRLSLRLGKKVDYTAESAIQSSTQVIHYVATRYGDTFRRMTLEMNIKNANISEILRGLKKMPGIEGKTALDVIRVQHAEAVVAKYISDHPGLLVKPVQLLHQTDAQFAQATKDYLQRFVNLRKEADARFNDVVEAASKGGPISELKTRYDESVYKAFKRAMDVGEVHHDNPGLHALNLFFTLQHPEAVRDGVQAAAFVAFGKQMRHAKLGAAGKEVSDELRRTVAYSRDLNQASSADIERAINKTAKGHEQIPVESDTLKGTSGMQGADPTRDLADASLEEVRLHQTFLDSIDNPYLKTARTESGTPYMGVTRIAGDIEGAYQTWRAATELLGAVPSAEGKILESIKQRVIRATQEGGGLAAKPGERAGGMTVARAIDTVLKATVDGKFVYSEAVQKRARLYLTTAAEERVMVNRLSQIAHMILDKGDLAASDATSLERIGRILSTEANTELATRLFASLERSAGIDLMSSRLGQYIKNEKFYAGVMRGVEKDAAKAARDANIISTTMGSLSSDLTTAENALRNAENTLKTGRVARKRTVKGGSISIPRKPDDPMVGTRAITAAERKRLVDALPAFRDSVAASQKAVDDELALRVADKNKDLLGTPEQVAADKVKTDALGGTPESGGAMKLDATPDPVAEAAALPPTSKVINDPAVLKAQHALESLTGMSEVQWLTQEIKNARAALKAARTPKARNAAHTRYMNAKKARTVLMVTTSGGSFISSARRAAFARKALREVKGAHRASLNHNMVSAWGNSPATMIVAQAQSLFRHARTATIDPNMSRVEKLGDVTSIYKARGAAIEKALDHFLPANLLTDLGYNPQIASKFHVLDLLTSHEFEKIMNDSRFTEMLDRLVTKAEAAVRTISGEPTYTLKQFLQDRIVDRDGFFDVMKFERLDDLISEEVRKLGKQKQVSWLNLRGPSGHVMPANPTAEMGEFDLRVVLAKAKVLRENGVSMHAYNEARKVYRPAMGRKFTGMQIILEADKVAARGTPEWEVAFQEIRKHKAWAEADVLFEKLARANLDQPVDKLLAEFEHRYGIDGVIKGEDMPPITPYQQATLYHAVETLLGIPDHNDLDAVSKGLASHGNGIPFERADLAREELVRRGAWAPRLVTGGRLESWSLDGEAKYWMDNWAHVPDRANPDLLRPGGALDSLPHDPSALGAQNREWGVLNQNMGARDITGELTKDEIAKRIVLGDPLLNIKPARELALQRKYLIERYGDIASTDGVTLIAFPQFMTGVELRAYTISRRKLAIAPGLLHDVREVDAVHAMIEKYYGRFFDEYIDAGKDVEWVDEFRLASRIVNEILEHPLFRKREFTGTVLRTWGGFWKNLVMSNPGFATTNGIDSGFKYELAHVSTASFKKGVGKASAKAESLSAVETGFDRGTQLFAREQTHGVARVKRGLSDRMNEGYRWRLRSALDVVVGPLEIPATISGRLETVFKVRLVRENYDGVLAMILKAHPEYGKVLSNGETLAHAKTLEFLHADIQRFWPSVGDGPIERLFNNLFPFFSYQYKNSTMFIGEAMDHPAIFNYLNRIGDTIEEVNREEYIRKHPEDPGALMFDSNNGRKIELPWAPGAYLDVGTFSDVSRAFKPFYKTTSGNAMTIRDFTALWVRLVQPSQQNLFGGIMNAMDIPQKWGWQQVFKDGFPTDKYEWVSSPWYAPWGALADPKNSFWPIELWDSFQKFSKEGLTATEATLLVDQALFFSSMKQANVYTGLNTFYWALKAKDPEGAAAWLLTDDGQSLKTGWMTKAMMVKDFFMPQEIIDILNPKTPDRLDWLWATDKEYQQKIFDMWAEKTALTKAWDEKIWAAAGDVLEMKRLKLEAQTAYFQFYSEHPEMYRADILSMTPEQRLAKMGSFETQHALTSFFNIKDVERSAYPDTVAGQKAYMAAELVVNNQKLFFLQTHPDVKTIFEKSKNSVEAAWKSVQDGWGNIFDQIGTREVGLLAATEAKDYSVVDQIYQMNDLEYGKLNRDELVYYFDPTRDFNTLPKDVLGPPSLKSGLLSHLTMLPDFTSYRFSKMTPMEQSAAVDKARYGVGIKAVIQKAKAAGTKANDGFDGAVFVAALKKDPWLLNQYFAKNPGKREQWAWNDLYISTISQYGRLVGQGKFAEASRYFEGMSSAVKARYFAAHPDRKQKMLNNQQYIGAMQKWVGFMARKDWTGGAAYFDSLPEWMKQKYYAKHPRTTSTKPYYAAMKTWTGMLDAGQYDAANKFFDALPASVKSQYFKAHPDSKMNPANRIAYNPEYSKAMGQWVALMDAGNKDAANKFFDALPQAIKNQYFKAHPDSKMNPVNWTDYPTTGASAYSAAMGQWVALLKAGDKAGGKAFFDALPQAFKDIYYKNHPDAKLRADIPRLAQLSLYFAASDVGKTQYLIDNPEFGQWLKLNDTGDTQRVALITAAYESIPSSDQWIKKIFRDKYPEIFSKEAEGLATLKSTYAKIAANPEMEPAFQKWVDAIWARYAQELKYKGPIPRPLATVHTPPKRPLHSGGRSAEWVSQHSVR